MKEINFATIITEKRREKEITQDELAAYAGVTKASVSKWETGQSYPDITLLPVLAAYFDISIDRLMGYSPQMPETEIDKQYQRLALEFTKKPFEEVIAECEGIIKKYYSCYPLLYKMALLYINHVSLVSDQSRSEKILAEAIRLCERVAENCKDKNLSWSAINLQAMCYLMLKDGAKVLELLGDTPQDMSTDGAFIAQAYQLSGNEEKAQEILQVDLFGKVMSTFRSMMVIIQNNLTCLETAEPVYQRAEVLAELFNMKHLNCNNVVMLYVLGAQMYQMAGDSEKAIELLTKYVDVCINDFFPLSIRCDHFFNKIEKYLEENIGTMPRNEAAVKNDLIQLLCNPIFEPLKGNPNYERLLNKLSKYIEGGN